MGNPVVFVDPSGLAPGDPFITADSAAIDAIRFIAATSMMSGFEYGGIIYQKADGKFYASAPRTDRLPNKVRLPSCGNDGTLEGYYHTHPKCPICIDPESFSDDDKEIAYRNPMKPMYVGTPSRKIKRHDPVSYDPLGDYTTIIGDW